MGFCEQLPDGRWRAFESEGSGGRRLRANAIRRTRTEARNAARAKLERKLKESTLEPHALTLSAYLERLSEHQRAKGRPAGSLVRDESVHRQIPKALAATKLADLAPLVIQQWVDESARTRSVGTARKRYKVLHAALGQAVRWRLLLENPCDGVTPPATDQDEMLALTEAQTAALLTELQGGPWRSAALVTVTTGLRRGELLALRWSDVDLARAELHVRRTVDEVNGKALAYKAPKSGKPRTVALMAATVAELGAHKAAQAAERLAAKEWHDHGLVYPHRRGESWRPTSFSSAWARARISAGERFDCLRWHDLRHTHATQLLRAGVDVASVSARLGHRSPLVTMQVYAHVLADAGEIAVARLESGLGTLLAAGLGTSTDTSAPG